MKWLRYIWQVIVGLFTVGIVLAAYSIADRSNDPAIYKVIVSGLALIVIQIASFIRLWAVDQMDRGAALFLEIREIKQKLEIEVEDKAEVDEAIEKKDSLKKKALVPSVFDYILWVIVIFNLIVTVLG